MFELWRNIFLFPLLNGLIMLYNTVAFGNLGVAVIEITILLRLFLFPLTIVAERNAAKYERLEEEVQKLQESFKDDTIQMKEKVRELLKKNKISHWAKAMVLVIQLLVLVAIYQVFFRGISASLDGLYTWVVNPTLPINTLFLGFDVAKRNIYWPLFVGVILYLSIASDQKKNAQVLGRSDAIFRYAFPLFTVMILFFLPMVKALFVLVSMLFSIIISFLRRIIWPTG